MSTEDNKKIVIKFFKALNNSDGPTIDQLTTNDFVFHPAGGADIRKDNFIKLITGSGTAFPDLSSNMDDIIAEGDKVAARMTVTGTHKGQFGKFAATGKHYSIQEYFFLRLENGRIAEDWGLKDALGHYQQLGILPPDDKLGE